MNLDRFHSCGPRRHQIPRQEADGCARGTGRGESECPVWTEFQFCKLKTFWRWMVMMVLQLSEDLNVTELGT